VVAASLTANEGAAKARSPVVMKAMIKLRIGSLPIGGSSLSAKLAKRRPYKKRAAV